MNKVRSDEESDSVITIQFDRLTHEIDNERRQFLKDVVNHQICKKSRAQLMDVMKTRSFVVDEEKGKVIHRKILKAVRRKH